MHNKIQKKIFLSVWLFYLITLLPVIGIIKVGEQVAADRYTYLPSIGPFLLVGLGVALLLEKARHKPLIKGGIVIAAAFIIGVLDFRTTVQEAV
ncbi:MAG: hypothetical protein BMS9Abin23_0605 [Thermodesulfobacteriota bacterium]|nr:MAG: hypothetical protein BMS9Abin23_0605 [Thermodesulfobacteriota bacterium]